MTETGTVQVDHHQFLLTTVDADPTDVTEEGNLIWTGPGFIAILTGIAYGPATVTVDTVAEQSKASLEGWEVVEETIIAAPTELHLMSLDGRLAPGFTPIPPGRYRLQVHAIGRGTHADRDVTEPVESYCLSLSSTTEPGGGIRDLRTTEAAVSSRTKHIPVLDNDHVFIPGPGGDLVKAEQQSPQARAVYQQRGQWGGRPPRPHMAADTARYFPAMLVADLDRALVNDIDDLGPDRQHALAHWCVRRAFERAGLTAFEDFRAALDAMDNDTAPPAGFANGPQLSHRLDTDPDIPLTVIPGGYPGSKEHILQRAATTTYVYGANSTDPVKAVYEAVRFAAETYGPDYPELLRRIRTEFPCDSNSDAEHP